MADSWMGSLYDYLTRAQTPPAQPPQADPVWQGPIQLPKMGAALPPNELTPVTNQTLDGGPKIGAEPHPWMEKIYSALDSAGFGNAVGANRHPLGMLRTAVQDALMSTPGQVAMAVAPFVTPGGEAAPRKPFSASELPEGFYSRVDRIADTMPNSVHPNKLATMLRSGAAAEELTYRNVDKFLANAGNQPVTKAAFQQHLTENPMGVSVKTYGEPTLMPNDKPHDVRIIVRATGEQAWQGDTSDQQLQALRETYANAPDYELRVQPTQPVVKRTPTKYSQYTLPNGNENNSYRENLIQLADYDPRMAAREQVFKDYADKIDAVQQELAAHSQRNGAQGFQAWSDQHDALLRQRTALEAERNAAMDRFGKIGLDIQEPYTQGHYSLPSEANTLVHSRTNTRTLAMPEAMAAAQQFLGGDATAMPEGYQVVPNAAGSMFYGVNPDGQVINNAGSPTFEGAFNEVRAHSAGVANPVSKGRFIEEVQSDWHQQGKEHGYRQPITDRPAKLQALQDQLDAVGKELNAHTDNYHTARAVRDDYALQFAREHFGVSTRDEVVDAVPYPAASEIDFPDFDTWANRLNERYRDHPDTEWLKGWHADDLERAIEEEHTARQLKAGEVFDEALDNDPTHFANEVELTKHLRARSTARERQLALEAQYRNIEQGRTPGVADAPFKESWPDLALKQQVLSAAKDPEAEWIGHTTGATQNERWSLSHHIDNLNWEKTPEGIYIAAHKDGNQVHSGDYKSSQLAGVIGRELAEKIIADPNQTGNYGGLDLKVGGEGHNFFYDNLLPKRLEKIVKPFGGQVEKGAVETAPNGGGWGDLAPDRPAESEPAWIAKLTPEMKKSILEKGLPIMSLIPALVPMLDQIKQSLGFDPDADGKQEKKQ